MRGSESKRGKLKVSTVVYLTQLHNRTFFNEKYVNTNLDQIAVVKLIFTHFQNFNTQPTLFLKILFHQVKYSCIFQINFPNTINIEKSLVNYVLKLRYHIY